MHKSAALASIIILVLVGFALRLYRIEAASFRGDEAFTVLNWVRQPLADTLSGPIPTSDPQPPLAYALFRGWGLLFGDGEFAMRLLPALFNLIGIPALYALGCRIGGSRLGLLAALLWAIHPFQIWHSQDARNYAIWAALSALSLWLALRAIEKQRRVDWILYVGAAVLAAYTYYLELFILAALNLYVAYLVFVQRQPTRRLLYSWAIAQLSIGLLLAPWFLQGRLLTGSGYGGTSTGFNPALLLTEFLPTLLFGVTLPPELSALLWVLVLPVLMAALFVLYRRKKRYAVLLALLCLVPTALLSVASLRLNIFTPRYILGIVPALLLLVGALVVGWSKQSKRQGRYGAAALLFFMVGLSAVSIWSLYFDYAKTPAWQELTTYLHQHMQPDDLVIQSSSDIAFTLYHDGFSDIRYLPANPNQPDDEIRQVLEESQHQYRSFWVVAQTPGDWQNAHVRDQWLAETMQPVRETNINGLPVRQFMRWDVRPEETSGTPLAAFDDTAQIVGVKVFTPPEPSGELTLWVYWQPINPSAAPLKAFVHLTGAPVPSGGSLWSQDDQFPQNGRISTTDWSADTVYRDVYSLPTQSLPPGEYTLTIGLYNPETDARVMLADGSDHYTIGALSLP